MNGPPAAGSDSCSRGGQVSSRGFRVGSLSAPSAGQQRSVRQVRPPQHTTVVAVFAKPLRRGEVKTRLARHIGDDAALRLARAFFSDTWALVGRLPVRAVLATTDAEAAVSLGVPGAEVWLQGDGPLGERLERVFNQGLRDGAAVVALGADSPGLPLTHLQAAIDLLPAHDAVIGPADDGGFYLLGLRSCPQRLFDDIALSTSSACSEVVSALRRRGLSVHTLPSWFDVDEPDDLRRLAQWLGHNPERAPQTAAALTVFPLSS